MTVTTPETGFRARLQRLSRRTAVFAIALAIGGFAAPGTASAAETPPADDDQTVELYVSAGLRGTVAPGSPTSAVLTLRNRTDSELTDGRVRVEIGSTPLADDATLTTWLDDEEAAGDFATVGSESTDAIPAGESATTTIFVPEDTLGELAPGIYPLRAELTGATTGGPGADDAVERDTTATSVLVVSAASSSLVGVLVPITATPADGGALLTADELAALTAPEGALTAQLDGVAGTTAILAIDPAILTAIRVLGTAAPDQATDWLNRLDDLPNERFALQFGDADAAVQAQAKLPELLQPLTFAPFLDPANFPVDRVDAAPTDGADGTPEPSPPPTEGPALPDDEELTEVAGDLPRILWPRSDVTPEDLTAFAGYLGDNTTTIVSSTTVGGQSAARATVDGHDLLVTDAAVSASLSDAATEADPAARQRLLAESAARLFLAEGRAPGAPLLIGLDRDETRTPDALREVISAADSIGFDFRTLRDTAPVAATISVKTGTAGAAEVTNLLADEQSLGAFASILSDPQVLLSPERIRILRTLAVSIPADSFSAEVAAHRALTVETLNAVSIPQSSTIQLISANADLPIGVRNDLPWPVTVQLTASPTDPRLEVKPLIETVVQANSTTRVKVPVSARVGSGEVDLRLGLLSPTGVPIQSDQIIRVAVRAEWETIGLGIFGGLTVLLIGLGVVRTVLRKRREAAEEAAADAAALEAAEPKDGRGE